MVENKLLNVSCVSFSFMFSSNKESRFYTKYTISTTGLGFFPVTVSVIKHTLDWKTRMVRCPYRVRKRKTILFKITENTQLSHEKKGKKPK